MIAQVIAGMAGLALGIVLIVVVYCPLLLHSYCRCRGYPWPGDYWQDDAGRTAKIEEVRFHDVRLFVEGVQMTWVPHWELRRDWRPK